MNTGTILVADDESIVRSFVSGILRRQGFDLIEAVDGVDALQQLKERKRPIALLLTDIRMPRMDGVALARSVDEMFPGLPVMYISGYPVDWQETEAGMARQPCAMLAKPFSRSDLLTAVQKCLPPGAAGNC